MKKRLVLVDFDHTLVKEDSFRLFLKMNASFVQHLWVGIRVFPWLISYLFGKDGSELKRRILSLLFKGKSSEELYEMGESVAREILRRENYVVEVMNFIIESQANEDRIVIVSGGLNIYLIPWSKKHNLELICSELEFVDGIFTGEFLGENCIRSEKRRRIEASINTTDYEEVICFGNKGDDDEMMRLGTISYVVDKQSFEVTKIK